MMKSERMIAVFCQLSLVSIFLCDCMTPAEINLPILYLADILLSLWHRKTYFSFQLAGLSTVLTIVAMWFYPPQQVHWSLVLLNRGITLALIWLAAYIVVERKKLAALKEQSDRDRDQAQKEVTELVNLLPMCAWCKKVRDDGGYWEGIESYLVKHATSITHGICPECSGKMNEEARRIQDQQAPNPPEH